MIGLGHIELEHLGFGVEFASRPAGETQPPAGSGQDDVGAFLLRKLGHAECERRVGQDASDQDVLAVEDAHGKLSSTADTDPDSVGLVINLADQLLEHVFECHHSLDVPVG